MCKNSEMAALVYIEVFQLAASHGGISCDNKTLLQEVNYLEKLKKNKNIINNTVNALLQLGRFTS